MRTGFFRSAVGGRAAGLAAALLATAALLPLCGCEDLLGEEPKPPVRLGTRTLLVLPFATPNRKHFESGIGRAFSLIVAELVRNGCPGAKVIDAGQLPETIEGRPLGEFSVIELGTLFKAAYVAVGEIHELRTKDPGSYKVLKGSMVLSARVLDIEMGGVAWQMDRKKFHYPRLVVGEALPAETEDEEEVARGVMREGAWAIAGVFRKPRSYEDVRLGR